MTEQQLANLFTPPDRQLLAIRRILTHILDERIREVNQELGEGAYGQTARMQEHYRNGITWAVYTIRDLIDWEGKILKEDLTNRTWPMDLAELVGLILDKVQQGQ